MAGDAVLADSDEQLCDVFVVGAGIGGLYAVHRFREDGYSVVGVEAASDVGGVWFHNRYPGARVDVDSTDYCYFFSQELYGEWQWSERYASQGELLRYMLFVVDRFDLRRLIRFDTRLVAAEWRGERWHLETSAGERFSAQFLVMASGNLSAARRPDFPGLDSYRGEWVQTSHWPDRPVAIKGRRVGVVGTGSSGVQVIPVVAQEAQHLHVFQRSPNFSVPAQNAGPDIETWQRISADVAGTWATFLASKAGSSLSVAERPLAAYEGAAVEAELERRWAAGGHSMGSVFSDQTTNPGTNAIVADFVRGKIRSIVKDRAVAEKLCPTDHPIGTRRLCVDTDYYATYNRDNVTLVDVREAPITGLYEGGIRTKARDYELDLVIFAIGFEAFTGQLDRVAFRNEKGEAPTDRWTRGPRTYLGLMTCGFPNLFLPTGPGSPSVLANMFAGNEYHVNWISRLMSHMRDKGLTTVTPTTEAEEAWTRHVAEVAQPLLRRQVRNYMVHVNADDGSRVFIPYAGGFDRYVRRCEEIAQAGYDGLAFS